MKKPFRNGGVMTVTWSAHAWLQIVRFQKRSLVTAAELTALIGMHLKID
jgi:hypothetical protein